MKCLQKKIITEDHNDTINILNKHGIVIANPKFYFCNMATDIYLEKNCKTPLGQLHVAFLEPSTHQKEVNIVLGLGLLLVGHLMSNREGLSRS